MVKTYIIINKVLPRGFFTATTVWPFIFVNKSMEHCFTDKIKRHEYTHVLQQIECLIVGVILAIILLCLSYGWWSLLTIPLFFWWYGIEWLIRLPLCDWDKDIAYVSISFEQEAYEHQKEVSYNRTRKRFCWLKYLFRKM